MRTSVCVSISSETRPSLACSLSNYRIRKYPKEIRSRDLSGSNAATCQFSSGNYRVQYGVIGQNVIYSWFWNSFEWDLSRFLTKAVVTVTRPWISNPWISSSQSFGLKGSFCRSLHLAELQHGVLPILNGSVAKRWLGCHFIAWWPKSGSCWTDRFGDQQNFQVRP